MMQVACEVVMDGPGPSEKVVRIKQADGAWEEVVAPSSSLQEGYLEASDVLAEKGQDVLIELPRESASGRWRLWVKRESVRVP